MKPESSIGGSPGRAQIFGATYMVVAPEHPLVGALTAPGRAAEVEAYVAAAGAKSDLERTDLAKGKSGVATGAPPPPRLPRPAGRTSTELPVHFVAKTSRC